MSDYVFIFAPNDKILDRGTKRIMLVIAINIEAKGNYYYCRDLNGRNLKKEVSYIEESYELFDFN